MLEIAPRTLRHLAAEDKIMRVVLAGPKQTRVYAAPARRLAFDGIATDVGSVQYHRETR
jgi:hypothetical protein